MLVCEFNWECVIMYKISSHNTYRTVQPFAFDKATQQSNAIVISAWGSCWLTVADPILHSVVETSTLARKLCVPFFCLCIREKYCFLFRQQLCNFLIPLSKALNLPAAPNAGASNSTSLCMYMYPVKQRERGSQRCYNVCLHVYVFVFVLCLVLTGSGRLPKRRQVKGGESADAFPMFSFTLQM